MIFRGVNRDDSFDVEKPYDGPNDPDLPESVQDLPEEDRETWVSVFNDAYDSCVSDGGSEEDCESEAFAIAWSVVNDED